MQKYRLITCSVLTALAALFYFPNIALAEQVIRTYSSHIEIIGDGSVNVQEEIVYDFGDEQHHGILRVIPLAIRALGKTEYSSLDISSILVTDGRGKIIDVKYEKGGNSATLTIGDANTTVSGPQLYVIRYTLWGAVTPNLVTDQFDWDVLGPSWQPGIIRMRAEIVFPDEVPTNKVIPRCGFISNEGKLFECDGNVISATTTSKGYTVRFDATGTPPLTSMMIQSVFPKGSIGYKSRNEKSSGTQLALRDRGIVKWWNEPLFDLSLFIPLFAFIALLSLRLNGRSSNIRMAPDSKNQYLLAAIAFIALSFFIAVYNLAMLLTGVIIMLFALFPTRDAQ